MNSRHSCISCLFLSLSWLPSTYHTPSSHISSPRTCFISSTQSVLVYIFVKYIWCDKRSFLDIIKRYSLDIIWDTKKAIYYQDTYVAYITIVLMMKLYIVMVKIIKILVYFVSLQEFEWIKLHWLVGSITIRPINSMSSSTGTRHLFFFYKRLKI